MEYNRDEAIRAKEIAEKKFRENDIKGAKKFTIKAQSLYPGLDGIESMLATLDVYISAESKILGEADWYGILGVDPQANDQTVRKRYRKLALMLHPDKNKSVGADGAFKLISEAWSLLSHKTKRLIYDKKRNAEVFPQKVPHAMQNTSTFWTACHRCAMCYEYPRVRLNQNLRCRNPKCHQVFLGIETPPPPSIGCKASTHRNHSQQEQENQQGASFQRGPFSKPAGAASAAQAATVVKQAYERAKRDLEEMQAGTEREERVQRKNQAYRKRSGFLSSGYSDGVKRRKVMKDISAVKHGNDNVNQIGVQTGGDGSLESSGIKQGFRWSDRTDKCKNSPDGGIRTLSMLKARTLIRKMLNEWIKYAVEGKKIGNEKPNEGEKLKNVAMANCATLKQCQDSDQVNVVIGSNHNKFFPGTSDGDLDSEPLGSMSVDVPDPDFHNFDKDRTGRCFAEHQVVRFRSLEKPKEDEFSLEFSKVHNYDDVVERVASHLGLDDPSKIRLTSHNCYSQQPKPQPIKYRGVEHLSDMLVHYNQTADILYYEVLDIPLPELQGLKTLKVAFHLSSRDEVVNHTIRLPDQSTVEDILNDLKTKVELSHPNAELRLLEIFQHKIYKIFQVDEKIENINDQYWTLRAEEIPEEEKKLSPRELLIHVYHFKVDAALNKGHVQNFGEPFFLVVCEGETLAKVKVRIQKRLQVPDEEFSKWKFAVLPLGRPEYLLESDIVFNRVQRRNVKGAWEQFLGLEHSDTLPKRVNAGNQLHRITPKKPYAANQEPNDATHVPPEPAHFVNASSKDSNDASHVPSEPTHLVHASSKESNGTTHVPSKPTHFVNASNGDSNDATAPSGKVRFLSYWVSSEASQVLEKIHGLHKETFVKFSVTSRFMQTGVLESFALFVESMLTAKVNELNEEALQHAFISVKEFEQVGLDLSWLNRRLEEVESVNKLTKACIYVESCETSLKQARAKVYELKEVLAKAKEEAELMSRESPESLGANDLVLEGVL